ncbi:hypothetical protein ABXT08_04330 [Chryseobacterium sp. NRRL B-14859]|uniref:FEKKY domain-containing protein n=1 Tax=Chryseobacterium sp. NRRL B-14859 TaxID=1562763 RepID=UPI003395DC76
MKNYKLFFLLMIFSFSGLISAQKTDDIKVVIKEKGKKTEIKENHLPHFIQFGIMSKDHENFRKKYKIDVVYQNCVISSEISKQAKENNLAIAKILTDKYGDAWKKDLGIVPYGL